MMSRIFQLPNDSKEDMLVKATTFSRHFKSEVDFVENNVNVQEDLLGQTNSPDTVLCMDALGSKRFSSSPSLQILADIEDKDSDEELGKAIEEDYSSGDLDENDIITYTLNKEAEDEIDRLMGKFKRFVMKIIYGETRALHDGTTRVENDLKLKIAMIVVNCNSISSNSYSHRSSCEERKSLILEPTNSRFESRQTDASKEIETPQNDLGHSKLPLPPRLREASYRNPLRLSSPRKDLIEFPPPSCFGELFTPKESLGRNSMHSALSKIVKKQKEISVTFSLSATKALVYALYWRDFVVYIFNF
jgi:hypothetical protein